MALESNKPIPETSDESYKVMMLEAYMYNAWSKKSDAHSDVIMGAEKKDMDRIDAIYDAMLKQRDESKEDHFDHFYNHIIKYLNKIEQI